MAVRRQPLNRVLTDLLAELTDRLKRQRSDDHSPSGTSPAGAGGTGCTSQSTCEELHGGLRRAILNATPLPEAPQSQEYVAVSEAVAEAIRGGELANPVRSAQATHAAAVPLEHVGPGQPRSPQYWPRKGAKTPIGLPGRDLSPASPVPTALPQS